MKLRCDGPDVRLSWFDDVNCSLPQTHPTGYALSTGEEIRINEADLAAFDNGVCTNLNDEYLNQLQDRFERAAGKDRFAYENAIVYTVRAPLINV